jgi:biopolymer transport protein ExbD/biopolymer transport protein TolR
VAFTGSNGRTQTSLAEINITPLVDVVLVLLVIFMLAAPVLQSGIEVAVPKTRTVKEISEQRMVVTIARDQTVYLGDQPINVHDLPVKLRQGGQDPAHQVIYLRADERVPFGAFASVMDAVKQAGITNISIVTQPLETKSGEK